MVALQSVAEESVEPVSVSVLGCPEVFSPGSRRVRETELSGCLVILTDQLVHLTIDSAV